MRQLAENDTILLSFVLLLVFSLLLPPLFHDAYAASLESGDATIAYFPARVGRYGQNVTVRAHIAAESQIQKVTLVIDNGKKPLRGNMPVVRQAGNVPVQVQATRDASIRTGPAPNKKIKGRLAFGEMMRVAGEKNGFYRGISASGIKGYILKQDVDIIDTGNAYAVTLPSSITSRSTLTYHIEAQDINGQIAQTEQVTMRLLTEKEIDTFLAMYGDPAALATPLYKKPLFWASMAALAGGAYLISSDKGDESGNQTTAEILVEWE